MGAAVSFAGARTSTNNNAKIQNDLYQKVTSRIVNKERSSHESPSLR